MESRCILFLEYPTLYRSVQRYVNLTPQRVAEEFARFHEMPERAESLTLTFTDDK